MEDNMIAFSDLKVMISNYCINTDKPVPSDNTIRNWLTRKNKKDKFKDYQETKPVPNEKRGNKRFFLLDESKKVLKEHNLFIEDFKSETEKYNKQMLEKINSFDEEDPSKIDPNVMETLQNRPGFNIEDEILKLETKLINKLILKSFGYESFNYLNMRDDIYYSITNDETQTKTYQYIAKQNITRLNLGRYLNRKNNKKG